MGKISEKVPETVLKKIQKCLALKQSPNENEAALAAEMANSLLLKYNLSLEDLGDFDTEGENVLEENYCKSPQKYKIFLMKAVAEVNFSNIILSGTRKKQQIVLIGKDVNIQATKLVYEYLIEAIDRIWKSQQKETFQFLDNKFGLSNSSKELGKIKRKYRTSFKAGAAGGLTSRLYDLKKKRENQDFDNGTVHTKALVVRNLYEQNADLIKKFMDKTYGNLNNKSYRGSSYDTCAFNNGYEEQKSISLEPQISGNGQQQLR